MYRLGNVDNSITCYRDAVIVPLSRLGIPRGKINNIKAQLAKFPDFFRDFVLEGVPVRSPAHHILVLHDGLATDGDCLRIRVRGLVQEAWFT